MWTNNAAMISSIFCIKNEGNNRESKMEKSIRINTILAVSSSHSEAVIRIYLELMLKDVSETTRKYLDTTLVFPETIGR